MKLSDEFTTLLHRKYLKPIGFGKVRRTFSCEHKEYIERYQLQGSAWNADRMPWTFYLNCGVTFIGLPRRKPDGNFPHVHAFMRAGYFTDLASPHYDVTYERMDSIAENLAATINDVSQFFVRRSENLKQSYLEGKYFHGFLDDAELNERVVTFLGK